MTLAEYAKQVDGKVIGDDSVEIERIAAIDDVDDRSLTFAVGERYLRDALASRAAAVLTEAPIAERAGKTRKPLLLVGSARAALAQLLTNMEAPRPPAPFRHPSAVVDESARIGPDVHLGPHSYVGPRAEVGAESVLLAGAVVAADARLGRRGFLYPHAMLLDRCIAGERVVLQAGAIVGSDGFGYVLVDGRFTKIPQVGNVVLGDDVEIGANTCIDRAQTGTTSVGDGTKIDNLVQVGHNCRIGKNSAFAALTGLAGSSTFGDNVLVGGQAATKGHVTIGSRVRIGGRTGIWGDIPDDSFISGHHAQDHREELRLQVRLRSLGKLYERVAALERER
jgi:UDP-3-O-[3-hydroxymyristoyl] glucosamine N-acyltransferase